MREVSQNRYDMDTNYPIHLILLVYAQQFYGEQDLKES